MESEQRFNRQLDGLCSLDDPTRRRVYDFVVAQAGPVTRDEASNHLDLERSTAAYHLDKLADAGLLAASFARPSGRGGPGAGRPTKHYERSEQEFAVSVPPRDYRLVAELLAHAVESDTSGTIQGALDDMAHRYGRDLVQADEQVASALDEVTSSRDEVVTPALDEGTPGLDDEVTPAFDEQIEPGLLVHLRAQGFEPYQDGETIRLKNCPFHQLARRHTELVCGMNQSLLAGVAEATGSGFAARLDPDDGRCCVVFTRVD